MGGDTPPRVRSSVVRVRDQYVLARFGKLGREQYRAAASPELALLLATPGDVWVDFGYFIEATELACRLFGDGSPSLARAIGAYGAEANMGPWRSLVHRLLSPRILLELAGMLWKHHYEGGKLVVREEAPNKISLRLEDFPAPHEMHCTSIEGWCERTLRFSRPKRVSVWQTSCRARGDAACEILGEWE
jgi:hypothetical protein